jgi:TDG/mug DNA glycosylase family protein
MSSSSSSSGRTGRDSPEGPPLTRCYITSLIGSTFGGEGPAPTAMMVGVPTQPRRLPGPDELQAAKGRTIADVVAPGLRVLFCGINPGLVSGATGHHFARPGNRFWRVLHEAGFTPRILEPSEQSELLRYGLGVTNLVARTTATAADLHDDELRAGAARLGATTRLWRPRCVAVLGLGAYRTAFESPGVSVGRQPDGIAGAAVWVLPNPSGLNASYPLPRLVEAYAALRRWLDGSAEDD